jgi:hypothetical protein
MIKTFSFKLQNNLFEISFLLLYSKINNDLIFFFIDRLNKHARIDIINLSDSIEVKTEFFVKRKYYLRKTFIEQE